MTDLEKLFGLFYGGHFSVKGSGEVLNMFDQFSTTLGKLSSRNEKIVF